jgi:hypothetical protein
MTMARYELCGEPTGSIPDEQYMIKVLGDELRYARCSLMTDIYNRNSGKIMSPTVLERIAHEIEDAVAKQLLTPEHCDLHMAAQCFVARAMSEELSNPSKPPVAHTRKKLYGYPDNPKSWREPYMDAAHEKELISLLGELPAVQLV